MLQDYVETVMEGLQTVANILAVKKVSLVTEHSYIMYIDSKSCFVCLI